MTVARKFTEAEKAELRDSIARSRVEAQEEMRRLAHKYAAEQAERRRALRAAPLPTHPTPLEIAGELAETLTALELAVADLDDDDLSADVHVMRTRLTKVGNRLARMKREQHERA